MARRYFTRPFPPLGTALLSPQQGHHLGRLIRTRPGASVILFDGSGSERGATVIEVRGREVLVDVGEPLPQPMGREPHIELEVVCAFPKKPRIDWMLEHGTEVGIRRFRPLLTERTNRQHERRASWERRLIEACAQCDRAVLPSVEETLDIDQLCALEPDGARYLATASDVELGPAPSEAARATLVVGPEGGLTDHECGQLIDAGFAPRSLGSLTLRTETAVLAGAVRLLQTSV